MAASDFFHINISKSYLLRESPCEARELKCVLLETDNQVTELATILWHQAPGMARNGWRCCSLNLGQGGQGHGKAGRICTLSSVTSAQGLTLMCLLIYSVSLK